jgi:beta-lactam-binding protein with PASTA domain
LIFGFGAFIYLLFIYFRQDCFVDLGSFVTSFKSQDSFYNTVKNYVGVLVEIALTE